ncbi:MAG: endonuclease/exonuclease/phosphatase family protein, partial [Myxococcota bacterium]|nr:endonuclease/exonuclease/phosphatase family protein [Myxococcota bacterium]
MSLNVRFVENTPKQCVRVFPGVLSVSGAPSRIRVISFNLLAPCWKRTHYGRESDNEEDWNDRLTRTIPVIKEQEADIICLQEFWFHPRYQKRFLSAFHPNYHVFIAQRGGQKPDGLALLLKASLFPVGQHRCLDYHDFGFRIAQVVHLPGMVIVNTHFTFPHATRYDPILRKQQAEKLSQLLLGLGDTPIILC